MIIVDDVDADTDHDGDDDDNEDDGHDDRDEYDDNDNHDLQQLFLLEKITTSKTIVSLGRYG